jgi:myosin-crossreactive antigen
VQASLHKKDLDGGRHAEELDEHQTKLLVKEPRSNLRSSSKSTQAWRTLVSGLADSVVKKFQELESASGRDKVATLTKHAEKILKKVEPSTHKRKANSKGATKTSSTVKDCEQILSCILGELQPKVNKLDSSAHDQASIQTTVVQLVEELRGALNQLGVGTDWIAKILRELVKHLRFRESTVEKHFQKCASAFSLLIPTVLEAERTKWSLSTVGT